MSNSLGNAYIKIRADMTQLKMDLDKAQEQIKFLETPAGMTTKGIEKHFKNLGVSSAAHFEELKNRAQKSFDLIKNHAGSTADDIVRAEKAKNEKISELNRKQFGEQQGFLDKAKQGFSDLASSSISAVGLITGAVATLGYTLKETFEKGFKAVETYNTSVASLAAMVVSFTERSKGVSLEQQWQKALSYSSAMVPILEDIAAKTLLSGEETTALANAFARAGVFLSASNDKQVEAFTRISNALPLLTQGQEIMRQINTEIRSLMLGTNESTSMLLTTLKAIDPEIEKHLETWRNQGTVLENIGELLVGFGPATSLLEQQWNAVKSTLDTTATQTLRAGMGGAYSDIIELVKGLNSFVDENRSLIAGGIAIAWATVYNTLGSVWGVLKGFGPLLKNMAEVVMTIAYGWGGVLAVIKPIATAIGNLIEGAYQWVKILASGAALAANAATGQFAAAKKNWADIQGFYAEAGRLTSASFDLVTDGVADSIAKYYEQTKAFVENTQAQNDVAAASADWQVKKTQDLLSAEKERKKELAETNKLIRSMAAAEKEWIEQIEKRSYISDADYNKEMRSRQKAIDDEYNSMVKSYQKQEEAWLDHVQKRSFISDEEYNKNLLKEQKATEKHLKEQQKLYQKIYDEMWNGIQNSFADTIYDMFDEGLDSWGDFFDSILDLFKKMLANMVAAWLVSGLKGLFTGTGSGFSLSGLFGSESSTGDGVLGLGVGGALAAGWDKITSGVSSLASALGLTTKAVSGLASETTVVANGMYEFGAGTTAATTGALALTGALIPLGAALAGSLGLDEVLFGGGRPSAYDMLHEWAAGVRDLTDAELTYYKAAYMSDFTGIDAQAMKDSISLQNEYAAYLGLTVDQMDALVQKRAELDIALRQEAGLLDWFNAALVDKSAETIKFELEELLATFELDPSDEWYKLKIGVDMAGVDPMNIDARASGGPVSANTPYIVGEEGTEMFWPTTSGHILNHSDTQRLLAMGIKGYASGTASLKWYEDPATHSSGTTEQEMWESLYASVTDFLDLLTDLQKEIEDINKTFEDYIETAQEVGATQEELDDIYEMWSESLQASADDWIKGVKDAIRDTFGLSGGLRDSLSDIRDQFNEWIDDLGTLIENGLDPGTTEAELRALEIASIVKAITDALKDMSQGLRDLQFSIASWVGKVTNTAGDLENAYYALVYARSQFGSGGIFDFLGLSESDLSEYSQDLEAYFQSVFNALSSAYESFISQQGTIADKIESIQVSGMALADRSIYYAGQLYDKLNQLADLPTDRVEEAVELTSDIYDTLLSYYSAEKEAIEDRYQTEMDAINDTYESMASLVNILESVNKKIQDLKYSSYNLALPTAKAEEAIQDYATLFAEAQTMEEDAVNDYLDFIDTYLQAGQDAFKSSTAYQDMYNQVMSDLASLGLSAASVSGKSLEDLTEEQNDLIASLEESMKQELATLDNTIIESLNILDSMISDEMEDVASLLSLLWTGIQDVINGLSTALVGASLGDINDTLYLFMGGVGGFLQTMDENNTANTDRLIAAIMGYSGGGTTSGMTYAEFYDYMNAFTEQLGQALYTLDTNQAARDATTQSLLTDLKNVMTTMSGKLSYYDPSSGKTFSNAALNFASYYAQRDLNKALGVPGYAEGGVASGPTSGYPVTLHGVEAVVPLASGAIPVRFTGSSMDEETKTLLRELVSVSKSKQRCEIVLDSGERLSGYIRKEADVVRVSANERQGVSRRRLY
jgi:hypothetical protein